MPSDIVIDVRMWNHSGIGTYIQNVVPQIVEKMPCSKFTLLGDREVLSCTFGSSRNVELHEVKSSIYGLSEQLELAQSIPRKTSLFWAPHYNIPVLYNGKLLVTVHDVFHLAMPQLLGAWHRQLYARFMFATLKRKASSIIAVSEFTSAELSRRVGIEADRISVIHEGVDASWFEIPAAKRPIQEPYLLFVGNVKEHKNLKRLLHAFGSLLNSIPHRLVVVGKKDGFITQDSEVIARATEFGERVFFTGHVSFDVLQQYYQHADALVFPSLYEGFGFPPLEAMACGCPAVVSNAASIPEICGDAAIYFNPYSVNDIAEKIKLALCNGGVRSTLKGKGRAQARQFTWESCIASTLNVINKLVME